MVVGGGRGGVGRGEEQFRGKKRPKETRTEWVI